jgi:hypothetical protein
MTGSLPPGSFPGGENLGLPPGLSVPLPGLGVLLGQENDCEFGVCSILTPAGTYNSPPVRQLTAAAIALYADFAKGVQVWISGRDRGIRPSADALRWARTQTGRPFPHVYGNYCGPGGSGDPIDFIDGGCLSHDYCYYRGSFSARDNFANLPSNRAAQLQSCNQALCNAVGESGLVGWGVRSYFSLFPRRESACH